MPFPSPGALPDPRFELGSLALKTDLYQLCSEESNVIYGSKFYSPAYNYLDSLILLIEKITLFLLSILHFCQILFNLERFVSGLSILSIGLYVYFYDNIIFLKLL